MRTNGDEEKIEDWKERKKHGVNQTKCDGETRALAVGCIRLCSRLDCGAQEKAQG